MSKESKLVLIDGDVIAYRAAAASEKRSIEVTHVPTGIVKSFSNRTEFKDLMSSKNKAITEAYSIKDIQEAEDISHSCYNIKTAIKNIKERLGTDNIKVIMSGSTNFRLDLPLPHIYKGNREGALRPVNLTDSRRYLQEVYKAIISLDVEADDLLNIMAYEGLEQGYEQVYIVTNDKDAYQAEGVHIYNPYSGSDFDQDITFVSDPGVLTKNNSSCRGHGFKFFAYQLCVGDKVDNFTPYYLAKKIDPKHKYGSTSAYDDLKDLNTTEEIAQYVVSKYKEWYPEEFEYTDYKGFTHKANWATMLDLYFRCAYMYRKHNDSTSWLEFFRMKGYE